MTCAHSDGKLRDPKGSCKNEYCAHIDEVNVTDRLKSLLISSAGGAASLCSKTLRS